MTVARRFKCRLFLIICRIIHKAILEVEFLYNCIICLFRSFKITGDIKYLVVISTTTIYEQRRYSSRLSTAIFRGIFCTVQRM